MGHLRTQCWQAACAAQVTGSCASNLSPTYSIDCSNDWLKQVGELRTSYPGAGGQSPASMDAVAVFPIFLNTLIRLVDVDYVWAMMALNPDGDVPRTSLWNAAVDCTARRTLDIRALLAAGQRGVWIPAATSEGSLPGRMRACNALSRLQLLPLPNPARDDLDAVKELMRWDVAQTTQLVLQDELGPGPPQVREPRCSPLGTRLARGMGSDQAAPLADAVARRRRASSTRVAERSPRHHCLERASRELPLRWPWRPALLTRRAGCACKLSRGTPPLFHPAPGV